MHQISLCEGFLAETRQKKFNKMKLFVILIGLVVVANGAPNGGIPTGQ